MDYELPADLGESRPAGPGQYPPSWGAMTGYSFSYDGGADLKGWSYIKGHRAVFAQLRSAVFVRETRMRQKRLVALETLLPDVVLSDLVGLMKSYL